MSHSAPVIGVIKELDLREVFTHEEHVFTPWLAANIHRLSELLEIDIIVDTTEAKVGGYELDILGRVGDTDIRVVIENQLGQTDHSHFGQLLAYAGGVGATVVVWVAGHVRDEHRKAVDWLNQNFGNRVSFYLVRPQAIRIDNSPPGVSLHLEAGPSQFANALMELVDDGDAARHVFRMSFWAAFLEYSAAHGHQWALGRSAKRTSWLGFSTGKSGIETNVSMATGSRMRVEIYCANDSEKAQFNYLQQRQAEIETFFPGEELSWERLDTKKASRVAVYRDYDKDSCAAQGDDRTELFVWMTTNLVAFRTVAAKFL